MSDKKSDRVIVVTVLHKLLINIAIALFFAIVTYFTQRFADRFWPKLTGFWHVWWFTLVGTVVVLLTGLGLYFFKKQNQRLYGLAEIGFALAVGWVSITKAQSARDAASWGAVVAAAYLIVRGLSNYDEGSKRKAPPATN